MKDVRFPDPFRGGHKIVPKLNSLLAAAKKTAITGVIVHGGVGKLKPNGTGTAIEITIPIIKSSGALPGMNYRGRWYEDGLIGKSFVPGDLIFMDNSDGVGDAFDVLGNSFGLNLSGSAAGNPVTFSDGCSGYSGTNVMVGIWWIVICTQPVTQNVDMGLDFTDAGAPNGKSAKNRPTVTGSDSFTTFCIGRVSIFLGTP